MECVLWHWAILPAYPGSQNQGMSLHEPRRGLLRQSFAACIFLLISNGSVILPKTVVSKPFAPFILCIRASGFRNKLQLDGTAVLSHVSSVLQVECWCVCWVLFVVGCTRLCETSRTISFPLALCFCPDRIPCHAVFSLYHAASLNDSA